MKNITIEDLATSVQKIVQEAAEVKGGSAYIKTLDVEGESPSLSRSSTKLQESIANGTC